MNWIRRKSVTAAIGSLGAALAVCTAAAHSSGSSLNVVLENNSGVTPPPYLSNVWSHCSQSPMPVVWAQAMAINSSWGVLCETQDAIGSTQTASNCGAPAAILVRLVDGPTLQGGPGLCAGNDSCSSIDGYPTMANAWNLVSWPSGGNVSANVMVTRDGLPGCTPV